MKSIMMIAVAILVGLAVSSCRRAEPVERLRAAQQPQARADERLPGDTAPDAGPVSAGLSSLGFQIPTAPLRPVDFSLADLDGRQWSLESLAGKVVFLNFWATWCPPCRAEMPSMESLHRELAPEGMVILAVNSQEPRQVVVDFVAQAGYSFPVLLDESGRVGAAYAVRAIPTTYLVNRGGYVLGRFTGSRDWYEPEVLAVLRRVLEP